MANPWTKFRNLCAYYADCMKYSEKRQEYLFADQEDNSFILPSLPHNWHLREDEFEISTSKEQLPARNLLLTAEEDDEIFVGYPMSSFIAPATKVHCLCPIILFSVHVAVLDYGRTSGLRLKIDRCGIDINRDWLEFNIPKYQHEYFVRSCERRTESMESIDVECALQFIANWFRMKLDPNEMDFSLRHSDANHNILNTATLFIGGKTKYTRSLIRELNKIKNEPDCVLDKTALAYVFRDPVLPAERRCGKDKIMPATFTNGQLNYQQYLALKEALNAPVTKVTGPPGTGKSHLSVNLIANEVFNGGSVLFTSKNHKAIHAVFEMCQRAKPDADFDLIQFCTVPGNDSVAKWDVMQDRLDTIRDVVTSRKNRVRNNIPEEVKYDALFRVKAALDKFKDAEENIGRYQNLRKRIAWLEGLVLRINKLLEKIPPQVQDDIFFGKLLQECTSAVSMEPRLSIIGRLKTCILRWLGIETNDINMATQLAAIAPEIVSVFSSDSSVRKIASYYLKLLKFKRVVDGWRFSELDVVKAEMSSCNYDVLKSALTSAAKEIASSIKQAYVDMMTQRIGDAQDVVISKIQALLSETEASSLSFLVEVAGDERYAKVSELFNEYHKFFPAWAVTLLSLRKASPCLPGVFSLVIIDEASQCEIPPIIPALFRAKRVAIVGDPEQFPPVITMNKMRNDVLRKKYGLMLPEMNKYSFRENNAFSVVSNNNMRTLKLLEHFRCMDEIAMYFNEEFYQGSLCPCVGDCENRGYNAYNLKPGMAWVDAQGGDEAEIDAALCYLKSLRRLGFKGTVGVISPLRKVANEMKRVYYEQKSEMPLGLSDERINTANSFQGGQCDVVLFLLGLNSNRSIGRDYWYITANENKYIYNVSVSRAKVCFTTFGDKKLALETGISYIVKLATNKHQIRDVKIGPGEEVLGKALKEAGFNAVAQYPILGRYLDFALVDDKIDIEVDGQAWHLDRNGCTKADDIHRDLLLEINGWKVIRLWHHEVMNNIEECIQKIKKIANHC